jgi:heme/copper-type cytochrome/quinol oxidase subunit 2
MKKSINIILAGVLAVPALALGVSLVAPGAQLVSAQPTLTNGALASKSTEQPTEVNGIFLTVSNTLLFIIGAVAVIMLIYGGFRYTTSGGDSGAVTTAKNTILYAIVGIIVAIVAYAVVNFVITQFVVGTTPAPAPAAGG